MHYDNYVKYFYQYIYISFATVLLQRYYFYYFSIYYLITQCANLTIFCVCSILVTSVNFTYQMENIYAYMYT